VQPTALALVLGAAFAHALWNLLAKRSGGGAAFLWLCAITGCLAYAPLAATVLLLTGPHIGRVEVGFIAGSATLHLGYFLALQRGYRASDLSVVYPVARGSGPLLSTAAAIAVLGERPTPVALAGAGLIGIGVLTLAGRRGWRGDGASVAFGLLTGILIACYTLWDKQAVGPLAIPAVILDWGSNMGRLLLLTPFAALRREAVAEEWRSHRREVLGVGLLSPLAYILVLAALAFTPVSYVAPAREVSILLAAFLGVRFLGEGDAPRRMVAAAAMLAGVVALAVG
jgi:drug/metabolite transporter (DMT)-like permease